MIHFIIIWHHILCKIYKKKWTFIFTFNNFQVLPKSWKGTVVVVIVW